MPTTAIRLKNLAFLLIGTLVLGFVGVRYADVGHLVGLRDHYTVRVQLATTGGLFTHSNVTYRGVPVGRVGPLHLTDDGVEAELRIRKSAPAIPADLDAVVANLSAVGEQYIDLRPVSDGGPYLREGAVIARADTRTPAPVTRVLSGVGALASSVDPEALRTVVDELGTALNGRGDDLQALLDSGDAFVRAADEALPSTTRLITDAETVLRTQAEEAGAITSFASGAKELAARLKDSDADLRALIAAAPEAAGQVSALLRDLDPAFGVVLANLLTTSEVAVTRQRGMAEFLVTVPALVAAGSTAVTPDGLRLGMSVTFFEPLPCTAGYGGTTYRNGLDLSPAPEFNTQARCTAPPSSGTNVRGSAHAPGGGR
ncbi:MCE family protein [Streptomyces sp. WAC05374]|uniref:MCE family protein n=1 Tax=Streptomyces sp. WAC05374 TaxID=2487420 RepID=UPI000F87B8FD|nr:MlaD family protein [Streptomyces sp. WAC05374]RST03084.1 MCE family protein [Streptomyces sp. WAC05374]TDF45957.1 MCE family protein [Streptomyces sp. WAC05374]TDF52951.1 MCE family protein [Streptomyces sp. WAC05374]TDF58165.1 MCE family protein [Streptomyces sp. WAC05374]